jgi:hypothetical protein
VCFSLFIELKVNISLLEINVVLENVLVLLFFFVHAIRCELMYVAWACRTVLGVLMFDEMLMDY